MGDRLVDLRPLDECVAEARAACGRGRKSSMEYWEGEEARRVLAIETNRRAFAMLDAAGYDLYLPRYGTGESHVLDLGEFDQTKKGRKALVAALARVCVALGCGFAADPDTGEVTERREAWTKKENWVTCARTPKDFPGLHVRYRESLPAGAKCRVKTIKSSYKSLVCG